MMRHAPWPCFLLPTLLTLTLTLALAGRAGPAHAADTLDDERARTHFVDGESHFAAERWSDAEREFALAYELSRRPEMLINLARAHERNGKLVAATADLELLLSAHPETSYRGEALQRLEAIRTKLATAPAQPAAVASPEPAPLKPTPGPVVVRTRGAQPPSLPTLVVGGVAVAAGVAALATGLRAHGIYNDLEQRCGADAACDSSFATDRNHGRALARASTALMFSSLALVGAAAVMWVVDANKADHPGELAFGVDITGARLRARF